MSTDRNLRTAARRQARRDARDERAEKARLARLGFDPMTPLPIPTTNATSPQVPPPGPLRVEIVDARTALVQAIGDARSAVAWTTAARDDHPALAALEAHNAAYGNAAAAALDEIDVLRRRVDAYERWRDSMSVAISRLGDSISGLPK